MKSRSESMCCQALHIGKMEYLNQLNNSSSHIWVGLFPPPAFESCVDCSSGGKREKTGANLLSKGGKANSLTCKYLSLQDREKHGYIAT